METKNKQHLEFTPTPQNKVFGVGSDKPERGFTLIELLVVIAIIGLLASVVLVSVNASRLKARDAKRVGDMNQILKAMEIYFNSTGSYPTTTGVALNNYGTLSGTGSPCVSGTAGCVNYLVPIGLVKMPLAPTPSDGAACTGAYGGATGNDYQYASTGSGVNTVNNFTITFCIGSQIGALTPGIHTVVQGGFQ